MNESKHLRSDNEFTSMFRNSSMWPDKVEYNDRELVVYCISILPAAPSYFMIALNSWKIFIEIIIPIFVSFGLSRALQNNVRPTTDQKHLKLYLPFFFAIFGFNIPKHGVFSHILSIKFSVVMLQCH